MTNDFVAENNRVMEQALSKLPHNAEAILITISEHPTRDQKNVSILLYGEFDFRSFAEQYGAFVFAEKHKVGIHLCANLLGCTFYKVVICGAPEYEREAALL